MTVIREGEVDTIAELIEPWQNSWTLMVLLTAAVPPGVLWHCHVCRSHDKSTTFLTRPIHCGDPMEVDDWRSLYDYFGVSS